MRKFQFLSIYYIFFLSSNALAFDILNYILEFYLYIIRSLLVKVTQRKFKESLYLIFY